MCPMFLCVSKKINLHFSINLELFKFINLLFYFKRNLLIIKLLHFHKLIFWKLKLYNHARK
jgi:hypothetical protein